MARHPRIETFPKIRSALTFYRICAYVTGVLLLLLCAEMVLKFGFGHELEMGGPNGFLALAPADHTTAFNLNLFVLIVHGWFYVVYVFACYRLWSLMRMDFIDFVALALGGVIPFMSFIVEHRTYRRITSYLAERERQQAAEPAAASVPNAR